MLAEGAKAPDFSLETDFGGETRNVSLKDFEDKTLVLYFYPKDSTPGCTREAQAFTAARGAIELAGGVVLGVSRDSVKSHCSFRDKYGLTIPLASDPDLKTHKAYGAWGKKVMYGKTIDGCIRSTFLVRNGRIARVFPNVKVDGHADQVLQAIGELAYGRTPTIPPPSKKPSKKPSSRVKLVAEDVGRAVKAKVKAVAKKAVAKAKKKVKKAAAPKRSTSKKSTSKK